MVVWRVKCGAIGRDSLCLAGLCVCLVEDSNASLRVLSPQNVTLYV